MIYSNSSTRRQDRLLDENAAYELLKKGEYGVLSMQAEKGGAYSVPISYVWDEKESVYFHCATEGKKLRYIALCNKVSFCIVGQTNVIPEKFTTAYESIVLDCVAELGLSNEEKMKALELLIEKYSPNDKTKGMEYAKKSFNKTEIVKMKIIKWSGKCKNIS
ncbi:MAG TPA: pyridoxamine 5'-phosphate oxidase family protein [Bacteroidetes bacterium]|nr:pyridoxamine 5'-phosphate oxidase family protein [Bacteroidota bacterium]